MQWNIWLESYLESFKVDQSQVSRDHRAKLESYLESFKDPVAFTTVAEITSVRILFRKFQSTLFPQPCALLHWLESYLESFKVLDSYLKESIPKR